MSFDFRLDSVCPHQVIFEELELKDSEYLQPISPLASSNLHLYINGMEIPGDGLYSRASLIFNKTGFSSIILGLNDTIELAVDSMSEQSIVLESGNLTIEQIVYDLQKKIPSVSVELSNGYLKMTSKTFGFGSKLKLGSGTAHTVLGIPTNRVYAGKQLYPGWFVVDDPTKVDLRRILFGYPLKSLDDIIEMSYFTSAPYCRRCHGLKIENDFRYDTLGRKVVIRDEDLLYQEVHKILMTIKSSNIFHIWYGTRMSSLVGSNLIGFMKSQILSEISDALDNIRDIKIQQARLQEVTPGEFPERLSVSNFSSPENDPTILNLELEVMSRRGTRVKINQLIRLPDSTLNGFSQGFSRS